MELMTVEEWRNATFAPGSRPAMSTIYGWIRSGDLPHQKIGGRIYIGSRVTTINNHDVDAMVAKVSGG